TARGAAPAQKSPNRRELRPPFVTAVLHLSWPQATIMTIRVVRRNPRPSEPCKTYQMPPRLRPMLGMAVLLGSTMALSQCGGGSPTAPQTTIETVPVATTPPATAPPATSTDPAVEPPITPPVIPAPGSAS